jgi:hypothetical protein
LQRQGWLKDCPASQNLYITFVFDRHHRRQQLWVESPFFPLGLDTIKPVGWSDVATEVTDSSPALSISGDAFLNNSLSGSGRITIDLLEDASLDSELVGGRLLLLGLKMREDGGLLVW